MFCNKCTSLAVFVFSLLTHHVPVAQTSTCHIYNDNGGLVNITKAQSSFNKVEKETWHELYCCADNFCQIDWYKDGLPRDGFEHPWNFTNGNQERELQLEDDNQTLSFTRVFCDVEGVWTCVVSGVNTTVNHTMEIAVTDREYTLQPIIKNHNYCHDTNTTLEEEVILYCPVSAKDVTPDVKLEWFRWIEQMGEDGANGKWVPVADLGTNGTTYTLSQQIKEIYSICDGTDKESFTGQYLTINKLTKQELGKYRLVATRLDDSKYNGLNSTVTLLISEKIGVKPILDDTLAIAFGMVAMALMLSIATGLVVRHYKGLDIQLWIKDRWTKESTDGKTYDAYIAYSESDSDLTFVVETLMPTLQKEGYVVFVKDIDAIPGETLVEQLISGLKESRRCILVISPDFLQARHTSLQLEVAEYQMMKLKSKIIPLILRSIKNEDLSSVKGLKRILSVLSSITWNDKRSDKSVKKLLLKMPPLNPGERDGLNVPLSTQLYRENQSQNSSQQSLVAQVQTPHMMANNDHQAMP